MRIKFRTKCLLCLVPSMVGIVLFYVIPYIRMVYYSLIDSQFKRNFVGLSNYLKTMKNPYFLLAFKNSMLLILIGVPALIGLSLFLSLGLSMGSAWLRKSRAAFVVPMVLPTAGIVVIWRSLFHSAESSLPVYLLFIWKNIGICVILQTAAFSSIGKAIYESAKLDGAGTFTLYTKITIPMAAPTILFSVLLSIVNSFKIFKESYLYYGSKYPPNHSYTLQYYMNNHFLKLNYQSLSCSAILTSVVILLIVLCGLWLQRRYDR